MLFFVHDVFAWATCHSISSGRNDFSITYAVILWASHLAMELYGLSLGFT